MAVTRQVGVDELKPSMVIISYSGFAPIYDSMDVNTCNFVKKNFEGSRAVVVRKNKKIECPVEQVKVSDTLVKIYSFPQILEKRFRVNDGLVSALKRRGFIQFEVKDKPQPKLPDPHHARKQRITEKAARIVERSKLCDKQRSEAAESFENALDQTRRTGKVNVADIQDYTEKMLKSGSTEAMQAVCALKRSDQTYAHSVDTAAIFYRVYYISKKRKKEPSLFKDEKEAMFAAFMHDFGKSKLPKDIIDSSERFTRDSREMRMIEQHPELGAELLRKVDASDVVLNMVLYHHVKVMPTLNSSYPKGISPEQMTDETKMLAIVDTYQALVGRRSYKKSWPPTQAIKYLDNLAAVEYDEDTMEDFIAVMGFHPNGSLLRLSDGCLAFVIDQSPDPEKPRVVPVQDKDGKRMQNHEVIDLTLVKDLSIKEDLDHEEVFGEKSLEIFTSIKLK